MSADILPWPHHKRAICRHPESEDCMACLGGLFLCVTCGAAEGELATNCPGYWLHPDERAATYNGHIDYQVRRGGWVCLEVKETGPPI